MNNDHLLRFSVSDLKPIQTTASSGPVASFRLRTSIGEIAPCAIIRRRDGSYYVCGPSARDRYEPTGFRTFCKFDPAFGRAVLAEVMQQIRGGQHGSDGAA